MTTVTVSATEFSRGLSDFLNQVQYQSQVLDIERGRRVIARLSPVSPVAASGGFPLSQLDAMLAKAPRLAAADVELMAQQLQAARATLVQRPDPWAS
jgi:hypothetical protein